MLRELIVVACIISVVRCISFEVETGRESCLAEDLGNDLLIVGAYKSTPSFQTQMFIRVVDPAGVMIWKTEDGQEGSFAFTTEQYGRYQICFLSMVKQGGNADVNEKRQVTLELKIGVDAVNYDDVAMKEHLDPLQVELRKLEDAMVELNKLMTYMRGREAAMRDTNESTNSRVLWLSILSMIVLISLSAWQLFYLKRYFRQKKLI